jgi:hypothetical protein
MKNERTKFSLRSVFAIGFAAVIVAAVLVGVLLMDSPAQERLRRLDERRILDLRDLSYTVDMFWTRNDRLPASLDELAEQEPIAHELTDPETGTLYEYRFVSDSQYELCAVFSEESDVGRRDLPYGYVWIHGAGSECFQLTAQDIDHVIDR